MVAYPSTTMVGLGAGSVIVRVVLRGWCIVNEVL